LKILRNKQHKNKVSEILPCNNLLAVFSAASY